MLFLTVTWNKTFIGETWLGVGVACGRGQVPVGEVSVSVPTGDVEVPAPEVPGEILPWNATVCFSFSSVVHSSVVFFTFLTSFKRFE